MSSWVSLSRYLSGSKNLTHLSSWVFSKDLTQSSHNNTRLSQLPILSSKTKTTHGKTTNHCSYNHHRPFFHCPITRQSILDHQYQSQSRICTSIYFRWFQNIPRPTETTDTGLYKGGGMCRTSPQLWQCLVVLLIMTGSKRKVSFSRASTPCL